MTLIFVSVHYGRLCFLLNHVQLPLWTCATSGIVIVMNAVWLCVILFDPTDSHGICMNSAHLSWDWGISKPEVHAVVQQKVPVAGISHFIYHNMPRNKRLLHDVAWNCNGRMLRPVARYKMHQPSAASFASPQCSLPTLLMLVVRHVATWSLPVCSRFSNHTPKWSSSWTCLRLHLLKNHEQHLSQTDAWYW